MTSAAEAEQRATGDDEGGTGSPPSPDGGSSVDGNESARASAPIEPARASDADGSPSDVIASETAKKPSSSSSQPSEASNKPSEAARNATSLDETGDAFDTARGNVRAPDATVSLHAVSPAMASRTLSPLDDSDEVPTTHQPSLERDQDVPTNLFTSPAIALSDSDVESLSLGPEVPTVAASREGGGRTTLPSTPQARRNTPFPPSDALPEVPTAMGVVRAQKGDRAGRNTPSTTFETERRSDRPRAEGGRSDSQRPDGARADGPRPDSQRPDGRKRESGRPSRVSDAPRDSRPDRREATGVHEDGSRVSFTSLFRLQPLGRFGRYDLLGRLAYGGMAEIFLARELSDDPHRPARMVVVKRVLPHVAADEQFVAMFRDEARLAMQLSHPNVCHVYAFGQDESSYYLAMEWVNGSTLSRMLRRARDEGGGLARPLALKVVSTIAEALDSVHRATDQNTGEPLGIVHRDVSPQNIMVSYDGVVKLLDFGIAKAETHSIRTEAGIVKGKYAYMAPEQCLGEPIDARADVFALGVCLYEALDGQNPFRRQTEFDTMRALVYEEAAPLSDVYPDITPEVDMIVARAIAKNREDRFQTAAELQVAIEHALSHMGEVVTSARLAERMQELFAAEIKAGPRLDTRIVVPPQRRESASHSTPARALPPPPLPEPGSETQKLAVPSQPPPPPPEALEPHRNAWIVGASIIAVSILVAAWWLTRPTEPVDVSHLDRLVDRGETRGEAAPTTGSLFIESSPSGAEVVLGERGTVGTTPMEIGFLPVGEWSVRLRLAGHEEWSDVVEVVPGERSRARAELLPIAQPADEPSGHSRPRTPRVEAESPPPTSLPAPPVARVDTTPRESGRLSINTRPWSKVYVGSRLLGTTPLGGVEVESGNIRFRFVDRDGVEHTRVLEIPVDGDRREFIDWSSEAPSEGPSEPTQ